MGDLVAELAAVHVEALMTPTVGMPVLSLLTINTPHSLK